MRDVFTHHTAFLGAHDRLVTEATENDLKEIVRRKPRKRVRQRLSPFSIHNMHGGQRWGREWSPIEPDQVTPTTLLQAWWRSDFIQINASPKTTGTTPPNIQFSGNLVASDQIHISVATTGTPGTAKVNVSLGGVVVLANQSTTAGTVAIPGSTVTIVFPASGSYTTQTWDSVCTQIRDKSSHNRILSQATLANMPTIINDGTGFGRHPNLKSDGTATKMSRTDVAGDFANAIFGGNDAPFEVWAFCFVNALSSGNVLWSATSLTDANLPLVELSFNSTGLKCRRRATAANDLILTSPNFLKTGRHLIRWVFDGTNSTVWDNNVILIPQPGTSGRQKLNTSITLNSFNLFAQIAQNGTTSLLNCNWYETYVFSPPLPNENMATRNRYYIQ